MCWSKGAARSSARYSMPVRSTRSTRSLPRSSLEAKKPARPFAALALRTALAAEPKISFTRQIKPILANKCFACHGPDEKERKAELRLDVRDEAVPSVIKPGDGEHSEVVVRITTDDVEMRMPPKDSKKPA